MSSDDASRVLSLLSHELRGPLGVIRGYLRLLEQTGPDLSDRHRQAVTAALKASDRAADLLTQVSMLAQLQRRETPFDFKPVAFKDVLRAVLDGMHVPDDPVVRLEMSAVPSARISADEALLRGALTTLVSAVVRAQAAETVLKMAVEEHTRDGVNGVSMTIATDTPRETLSERAIDIGRGGLGLGLPIAQHLIATHQGDVRELRNDERYAGVVVWLPTIS